MRQGQGGYPGGGGGRRQQGGNQQGYPDQENAVNTPQRIQGNDRGGGGRSGRFGGNFAEDSPPGRQQSGGRMDHNPGAQVDQQV